MAIGALWHGTQIEALELLQALSRNCSCVLTAEGVRLSTCAPHAMLASDQRAIDGLLFARRIAARLRTEEFSLTSTSTPTAAPGQTQTEAQGQGRGHSLGVSGLA
jgi:hypothetical protein